MSFCGKITGYVNGFLMGWAYNPKQLDERIIVEIYADDYPISLLTAQVWLSDLADIGDGCYGFCQAIPTEKLRAIHCLTAKVANSDYWLEGMAYPEKPSSQSNSPLLGYVSNQNGLRLEGWAWNPFAPKQPVKLQIFEKNRLLGEVLANQTNEELLQAGLGNGKYGFSFTLPFDLADGNRHEITVLNEQGQTLQGCPLSLCSYPQAIDQYLQNSSSSSVNVDLLRVLATQFQTYQKYLPASVDFSAYPEWAKHFGYSSTRKPSNPKQQPLLVLVFGKNDQTKTIDSLLAQSYQTFHVLVQGHSTISTDQRFTFVTEQDWPSVVTKTLANYSGLLSFVEAGDAISDQALTEMSHVFDNPSTQAAYSDCDFCLDAGPATNPWFKPDWDLDLFLAQPLAQHLFVVRSHILPKDSPWLAYPECWPWLAVKQIGDSKQCISHVPQVLYHRSQLTTSSNIEKLISECLPTIAPGAVIGQTLPNGLRKINWQQPDKWPKVSLIIPTRDQKVWLEKCITSLKNTDYPDLEIIIVDNASQEKATLKYLQTLKKQNIKVIPYPHRFNYSAINNFAVNLAEGSIIGLINNDVEAINADWLKIMVTQLQRQNVGAVGAKLLWQNGMVQHGGVLLGLNGLAGHIGNNWEEDDMGYYGYNQLCRKVSAVTAACLVCYKQDYLSIGGLNAQAFPVAFNDVDFCLRLGKAGKHIIWTPEARLWHAESISRGIDDAPAKKARLEKEKAQLRKYWGDILFLDPYYNPNLNLDQYSHNGLAFPPRITN